MRFYRNKVRKNLYLQHILKVIILTALSAFIAPLYAQEPAESISASFPYDSHYIDVLGSKMHYVDEGEGEPVLFIHGNPTSSYLWRNVIPHVSKDHRAIAIDLIGMGKSDKPDIAYTYIDHKRYVQAFIKELGLRNITFVIHDWGSVLGFDYAMNNVDNVKAIAFMEALIPPNFPAANEPSANTLFGRFRTEGVGEKLIFDEHFFVEQLLPSAVVRNLTEEEMDNYRSPFLEQGTRLPVLQWPRELPMGGNPAANAEVITNIGIWMKQTQIPMLHLWAKGSATAPATAGDYFIDNVRNLESVYLGVGRHYLQEDHPEKIGRSVNEWLRRLDK